MDVKKVAAILAATAVMSTASLTVSHSLLIDNMLSVSAASYLRLEATGTSVRQLQQRLVALNYMKSDSVTGTFDATTDGAVKNLQTDYNMKVDGVVGPETTELIEGLVNGTAKVVKAEGAKVNIRAATNTKCEIIGTVNRGQKLKYDDYKTVAGVKWYHVSSGEMKGYLCGTYASVVSLSPVTVNNGGSVSSGSSGTLKVTGTVLNVRSSASTSAKKLTTLKRGEIYPYSSVKQVNGVNWYYVYVNSRTSGWVMGTFIARQGVPTADSGTLKVTGTFLNVRADASLSAQKVEEIRQGGTYSYSEIRSVDGVNWYHIRLSDTLEGWVIGTFVIPVSSGTPSAVSESGSVKIKGNLLNVRADASRTGKKLTQLHTGETYTYSEVKTVSNEKWYYIRVSDRISGWVIGEYVTATPNAAPSTTSSETTTTASSDPTTSATQADIRSGKLKVTGGKVNVRSGPGTNYHSVGTAEKGKSYTYTDSKNGWYFIALSKYNSGWIIGDYVQATPDDASSTTTTTLSPDASTTESAAASTTESTTASTESATSSVTETTATSPTQAPSDSDEEQENGKLFVREEYSLVNVREDAGLNYKVVEQVAPGVTYSYTKVKNGWFFIRVNENVSGWIMGDFIEATPEESPATTLPVTSAPTDATESTDATEPSDTTDSDSTATTVTTTTTTTTTFPVPPLVDDTDETGMLTVMDSNVEIYTDSDSDSTVVAAADKGQKFSYHGVRNGWFFVKVSNTLSGWIMGQSVEATPDTATTTTTTTTTTASATESTQASSADPSGTTTSAAYTPASDSGIETGVLTVTAGRLRVRTGAGTSYDIITEVSRGQILNYSGIKDGWYCIVFDSTLSGWVMGDYVRATPATASSTTGSSSAETTTTDASTVSTTAGTENTTEEPTTTTTPAKAGREVLVGTIKVNGSLNVRKGAGTNYASLGTIKNGSTVVIAQKGSNWHKIEYNGGYGYVSVDYVKDIKTTYESQMLVYQSSYHYVNAGNTLDLGLTVGSGSVTYTSSDSEGCPVSEEGIVSGKTPGLYTVTAKGGLSQTSTCVVVLRQPYQDIAPMTVSEAGTKFIADWEGGGTVLPTEEIVFYPYQDVSKFWTIGYGHAKTTTVSKSWSEERAVAEFNADIERMIGAEHILTDEKPYLTLDEATALLNADLKDGPYAKAVSDWAVRNGVKLSQTQFDALVSFCYNLGPSMWESDATMFYLKSAILAYRCGDDARADQVIEGFCRYMKSSGKYYKGLWYRRRNEAELFLKGDYALDRENKFKLPADVDWA